MLKRYSLNRTDYHLVRQQWRRSQDSGILLKRDFFNYLHLLVFFKFLLFSNAIINGRDILVNHNYLKETCSELIPNAKPILCDLKYFKARKRFYEELSIF